MRFMSPADCARLPESSGPFPDALLVQAQIVSSPVGDLVVAHVESPEWDPTFHNHQPEETLAEGF